MQTHLGNYESITMYSIFLSYGEFFNEEFNILFVFGQTLDL